MSRNPFSRKTRTTQAPQPSSLSTAQPPTLDRGINGDGLPSTAEQAGAKSTSPGGDADFALVPAPAGAGTGPAHGAGTGVEGGLEAERGLHQDQPDDDARFAPTVTPAEFVHHGVAANDVPAPDHDDTVPGAERRRRLSDVLYRPRSGTRRSVQLTCSAEPAERVFLKRAARESGRSLSGYLMDAGLAFAHAYLPDQRPEGVSALPSPQAVQDLMVLFGKLLREFQRVGSNLNQLMRAVHSGVLPDRAEEILDELHQVAVLARRALEQVLAGGGRRGA
ncbi:hypothetical protein [Streptacidiphilus anmyonensis]|uniref:hypothetical protein n=1 Tax=Streptacidiphilus anmyonensis TaxID=405782 RepID=UPI00128CDB4E|nr:hypothetical protein [Streptacidiphilus anmyonensis]